MWFLCKVLFLNYFCVLLVVIWRSLVSFSVFSLSVKCQIACLYCVEVVSCFLFSHLFDGFSYLERFFVFALFVLVSCVTVTFVLLVVAVAAFFFIVAVFLCVVACVTVIYVPMLVAGAAVVAAAAAAVIVFFSFLALLLSLLCFCCCHRPCFCFS
jgi:hypothetical protein